LVVGQLTARLREHRRLITLLDGDASNTGEIENPFDHHARLPRLPRHQSDRLPAGQRRRRRPGKRGLTLLSLNRTQSDVPPSPWTPDPEITDTAIWLRRLPAALEGLKIVHLTDIHHSLFTPVEEVERVVHLANRLEPDVVALTGDYVTLSPAYIAPVARALGRLRARRGIFAVLGNHDFQVDAGEVTRALRAERIRVLRNSRYPIRAGGRTLWFLGVDDLWWESDDLPAALRFVPARDPKVLLCHNPRGIWQASEHGIDLVLSGHTHGGQVRLPGLRSLYRSKLGERFVEGWNRLNGTQIYVSRGIGKVVVPLRLGCPPEITCLRLHRAS
jgi:predicted MPP superfamily phosphohydrolase